MRFVAYGFLVLWTVCMVAGWALIAWAKCHLPAGTSMAAVPVRERVFTGPYRFLRHPMYLGNVLVVVGVGGMGGGALTALAFYLLSVTVFGEWAAREDA